MKPKAEISEQDAETYFRFFNEIGIINQLASSRAERVLPHGLTISQFSVLNHFVRLQKPRSPLGLANAFQVTKGAMTNTLKQLEHKGFVNITPHETDRRSKIVFISDTGRKAHAQSRNAMFDFFKEIAVHFSSDQLDRHIADLESIRVWLDNNR